MLKIMGLVTGALAAAAGMLAVTGVPRVAGVDWHASADEPLALPQLADAGTPAGDAAAGARQKTNAPTAVESAHEADVVDSSPVGMETVGEHAANEVMVAATAAVARNGAAATDKKAQPMPERVDAGTSLEARATPGRIVEEFAMDAPNGEANALPDLGDTPHGFNAAEAGQTGPERPESALAATGLDAASATWQPVWAPFRSELSARGFMGRLERLTDLHYRVSKIGPGLYQVAFAHADFDERVTGIAAIETATGLDLARTVP